MAADLHIHILTKEFTQQHYMAFRSNTLGSQFFNLGANTRFEKKHQCDLCLLCADTPNVWVGEVSWLKAVVLEDAESYIPAPIQAVSEIIGERFPVIDDTLIQQIQEAVQTKNQTEYRMNDIETVLTFLRNHEGEQAFTISW